MFGGHQGLMAIEVDVSASDDRLVERVQEALDQAFTGSAELVAAQLRARATMVRVDHLLPPDEPDAEVARA
jgi:hypothetical protein